MNVITSAVLLTLLSKRAVMLIVVRATPKLRTLVMMTVPLLSVVLVKVGKNPAEYLLPSNKIFNLDFSVDTRKRREN